jgi:hypothetical protein
VATKAEVEVRVAIGLRRLKVARRGGRRWRKVQMR